MGVPKRFLPRTKGNLSVLTLASLAKALSFSWSGEMSLTTALRSRKRPSASIKPGFSLPGWP
jgi:hypothetical protein